ncbi:MAG: hypothetical protein SFY92_10745 [Verrucomicrobiae bacterium]|nr:hypothetical protein [Verrucomicrobiae bacterium]
MTHPPLPTDRWCEMSLSWFDPKKMDRQAAELLERLAPLYRSVSGTQGLLIESGFRLDVVTEWTGDPDQLLPIRAPQLAVWEKQSYRTLGRLFDTLKKAARKKGLKNFRVGLPMLSCGDAADAHIYDFKCPFQGRHPEMYDNRYPANLCPGNPIKQDRYPYASLPKGLPKGMSFNEMFGRQWGVFSGNFGADLLVLRDGWLTTTVYSRQGPWGLAPSKNPGDNKAWTDSIVDLYRQLKKFAPQTLIAGYSGAMSAVGELRVGGADLEAVVAAGDIDVWIDQTWAGAWQDWWTWETLGWTMQMANMLTHGIMIARGNRRRSSAPCRHFNLIETWDAWEPWDTLHQVPEKLRWGIWAFSHACVKTPEGLKVPEGTYLSWVNNRTQELWSREDVSFLTRHLNAAQESARHMEQPLGPTLVYNRPMMEWLNRKKPALNASEWIDDQAGMLMKWACPILSITDSDWLEHVPHDALIVQSPGQLPARTRSRLLARSDRGVILAGRADLMAPDLLRKMNLRKTGPLRRSGFARAYPRSEARTLAGIPEWNKLFLPDWQPCKAPSKSVLFESEYGPLMVRDQDGHLLYWQPPDWYEPGNPVMRRCQVGSLAPYVIASDFLEKSAARNGSARVVTAPHSEPVTVHLWKGRDGLHVLAGNLETGITGDARNPRQVTVILPGQECGPDAALIDLDDGRKIRPKKTGDGGFSFSLTVPPEGLRLLRLQTTKH